jgi:23S rRNA (uracil1939-C5)-methyltransferase
MKEKSPDIEIELTHMVYGGEAMGKMPDGRVVFVPYALPGERIRAYLRDDHPGYAHADLIEILQPSPKRIVPRCFHFGTCGGCHYQNMNYFNQVQVKAGVLKEQFERIARIPDPNINTLIPSEKEWNYRNSIQFHLNLTGKIGFQAARSHELVAIRECHLPDSLLDEIWRQFQFEGLEGIQRVELMHGMEDDVLLRLEGEGLAKLEMDLEAPISVVLQDEGGETVMAGENFVTMEVLGRSFKVSAGSFFQVNTELAGKMVEYVLSRLPLKKDGVLLDLYCGVGLFSAFLAPQIAHCIGVEMLPSACLDFAANLDEFDNVDLYEGAAEDILPYLDVRPNITLVDPPRSGLHPNALAAILKMQPGALVYVSCDPATLCRDAKKIIQAGYFLEEVTPFDLFPQTFHLESISVFRR